MTDPDWLDAERLHFAAQDGDLDQVRRLLSEGRDVNAFDELGKNSLALRRGKEHVEVAQWLIEQGADVNARHEPASETSAGRGGRELLASHR